MTEVEDPRVPAFSVVRFYRMVPGDAGFRDFTFLGPINVGEVQTALLHRFKRPKPRHKPPTQADVVDAAGQIILKFRVVGPDRVDHVAVSQ